MSRSQRRAGTLWARREAAVDSVTTELDEAIAQLPPAEGNLVAAMLGATKRQRPRSQDAMDPVEIVRHGAAVCKAKRIAAIGCMCESCKASMPSKRLVHLHHVVFVSRGGTNEDSNTALLCLNCHGRAHWLDGQLPEDERPRNRDELLELLQGKA